MSSASNPALAELAQCVRMSLQGILQLKGEKAIAVPDSAILAGTSDALLDSLALVMFLSELEQEVERCWGVSVDLFGEMLDNEDGTLTLQSITAYIHRVVRLSDCHSTSFAPSERQ